MSSTEPSETISAGRAESRFLRRCHGHYLSVHRRIWKRLPTFLRRLSSRHLHTVVRRHSDRRQSFGTFFLRNRAELELMRHLLERRAAGSKLDISVLACSKGAEVYSIQWAIRSARPDLKLTIRAVDISQEILDFAKRGVYLRNDSEGQTALHCDGILADEVSQNTCRDQIASIFERMTPEEVVAMFEVEGDQAKVRPWLKEGLTWLCGDAGDPQVAGVLGPQDIVVANRFLCHMKPEAAERCLRNIAGLVKPGGYLFVSGIDLDVRTWVAQAMGWDPVTDMMREVHEGDVSLRNGWPLEYWGLEPFRDDRPDWRLRYASVFQIGGQKRTQ